MGDARRRFKSCFSSATALWPTGPSRSCLYTLTTISPRNAISGRSSSSQFVQLWQDEHVDLVGYDFNGAAWRQLSGSSLQPTSTLRGGICRPGLSKAARPHNHCGAMELFLVNGPTYVASSFFPTHMNYGRYANMEHSQCLEKSWVSVKETRAATMRYGYTWNSSVADMLTDHE